MFRYTLPLLLVLAACASPREKCIINSAKDLRMLDALIAEQQQIVNRGFRVDEQLVANNSVRFCAGGGRVVSMQLCNSQSLKTRERPVAVDIPTEQRKLQQLLSRRDALASQTARAQAMCPAQ